MWIYGTCSWLPVGLWSGQRRRRGTAACLPPLSQHFYQALVCKFTEEAFRLCARCNRFADRMWRRKEQEGRLLGLPHSLLVNFEIFKYRKTHAVHQRGSRVWCGIIVLLPLHYQLSLWLLLSWFLPLRPQRVQPLCQMWFGITAALLLSSISTEDYSSFWMFGYFSINSGFAAVTSDWPCFCYFLLESHEQCCHLFRSNSVRVYCWENDEEKALRLL